MKLIGKRYGSLIVESVEVFLGVNLCKCSCDCGGTIKLSESLVKNKKVTNCGCIEIRNKIRKINKATVSRYTDLKLYKVWIGMKSRCYCHSDGAYRRYGGKGVRVCREWRTNFETFKDFCLSHGWREGLEIDRENNSGNYEPSNCRFVTRAENSRNQLRSIHWEIDGKHYGSIRQASDEIGISQYYIQKLHELGDSNIKRIMPYGE